MGTSNATDAFRFSGSLAANIGRAPKTDSSGRVCASDGCDTVLSRYNLESYCRRHTTPHFPVLRGVPTR